MATDAQRFYLPDELGYIEYSVKDVDYDYANIVVAPIDETAPVGIGYILREDLSTGDSPEADGKIASKRWFAYDAGVYGGTPGRRVGSTSAGYATMENAIRGLLIEHAVNPAVVRDEETMLDLGPMTTSSHSGYGQRPLIVDPWEDTAPSGRLDDAVIRQLDSMAGIHAITARLMQEVISSVARTLWSHHDMLANDHAGILIHVGVDIPMDLCGGAVIDESKPFDGMTLSLEISPSPSSVIPHGSLSISVVDIENATDANVLVGTSVVNGGLQWQADAGDGVRGVGLSVDSMASEATSQDEVEEFVRRIMTSLLNGLMRAMILEYQSMLVPFDGGIDDDDMPEMPDSCVANAHPQDILV